MKKIECWIDGACEPKNPGGEGSFGVYALCDGEVVIEDWGTLGNGPKMTNNVAEYTALYKALGALKDRYGVATPITIYSDSQLVVNQMNREWPVRSGIYVESAQLTAQYATQFQRIKYIWIPREKNGFADALSKRALAEKGIKPHYSRR